MTLALIGIISSVLTSFVKYLNDRLVNTPLKGNGATIVSIAISLVGSVGYQYYQGTLDISNKKAMVSTFSMIFVTAELYYKFVVAKFFKSY